VRDLLYGARVGDMWMFAGVSLVLLVATFAACYVNTQRAMRVDPAVALRDE
jgi:ABC-type lipoprotein release transport system permease subunit